MNKVYSILIQEEQVKTITRGKDNRGEIMVLATRTQPDGKDKSSLLCSHCNRTGHESETCFALHGYPEWWGDKPRSDGKGTGRGRGQTIFGIVVVAIEGHIA